MPLGFERLNERVRRPNAHINFIKPLERSRNEPTGAHAQDYLERVAAIVYPLMKANHLVVMSLEEFPPNPEFAGRNFNAGEVIQLVLRAPGRRKGEPGPFLPFRHIQMVMVHELAHCKEMNHSRAFWRVRNQLAAELKELWAKGYTGEGFWARGQTLLSQEYTTGSLPDSTVEPRSLCGGTFKTSRRKRKRKGAADASHSMSYAERQQRRIRRKFGEGGVAVGVDHDERSKLEGGRKTKGKPRVAASARGRELRAAAALARFEVAKQETTPAPNTPAESDTDSDYESDDVDASRVAVDTDGNTLTDSKGHGMVRVCDDEDGKDPDAKQEMEELRLVDDDQGRRASTGERGRSISQNTSTQRTSTRETTEATTRPLERTSHPASAGLASNTNTGRAVSSTSLQSPGKTKAPLRPACPICSLENEPSSLTCGACANVLDPRQLPGHWRCFNPDCADDRFINAGDCGLCGLCGTPKPVSYTGQSTHEGNGSDK